MVLMTENFLILLRENNHWPKYRYKIYKNYFIYLSELNDQSSQVIDLSGSIIISEIDEYKEIIMG